MVVDSWGIEQQRIRSKNRSSIDPLGVEKLSRRQVHYWLIHQVSRSCRDWNKKKAWKARQIARYWGGVELAFQNSFSRGEKHKHECNPTYNSTNDPINTIISQIVSQFKKFWAQGSPKHTHTLNKSNQFYISKTKLRQFSEHTLTHVKLVMAKSHWICTCIKNSKEYCVLCVKNITRLHKGIHVMTIWDMRKLL